MINLTKTNLFLSSRQLGAAKTNTKTLNYVTWAATTAAVLAVCFLQINLTTSLVAGTLIPAHVGQTSGVDIQDQLSQDLNSLIKQYEANLDNDDSTSGLSSSDQRSGNNKDLAEAILTRMVIDSLGSKNQQLANEQQFNVNGNWQQISGDDDETNVAQQITDALNSRYAVKRAGRMGSSAAYLAQGSRSSPAAAVYGKNSFNFGLGKRPDTPAILRPFEESNSKRQQVLGKRLNTQKQTILYPRYDFGLGKRVAVIGQRSYNYPRFDFGLGKRSDPNA